MLTEVETGPTDYERPKNHGEGEEPVSYEQTEEWHYSHRGGCMWGEKAEVLIMDIACYVGKILELWVVAGTQTLKEGFGDDAGKSCGK